MDSSWLPDGQLLLKTHLLLELETVCVSAQLDFVDESRSLN
jgi:hypothetical protein